MSLSEQNKSLVRQYLDDVVTQGNLAAVDRYFSQDVVFNGSKGLKQQMAAGIQAMRSAFPDHRVVVRDQIAEGDKVVTRVTFHGTHRGAFRGVPATGKAVEWPGIAIDRIADGKVVEMWHMQNMAALLQQIDVTPPSGRP